MNIAIIGAGNMGSAIVQGLLKAKAVNPSQILVVDPNADTLEAMQSLQVQCFSRIADIKQEVHLVMIAVKPWLAKSIMHKLRGVVLPSCIVVSIAAGVTLTQMREELNEQSLFRVIPNTAIAVNESMSFICSDNASHEQVTIVQSLFNHLGKTLLIAEEQMAATTALSSCGIAYAMRYISANMRAGVEVGLSADMARSIMLQTLQGAISLLSATNTHPEAEIDRVSTPKGLTIKGINELDHSGFTSSIIKAVKAAM
ncbi:MAG: pyrroline-5-carboxylate reductase [Bacteroidales bacterium]